MVKKITIIACVLVVALGAFATPSAAGQGNQDDCTDPDIVCLDPGHPGNGAPEGVPPNSGVNFPDSTFDTHFPDSTFDTHFPESTFDGKTNFPESTFSGKNPVFDSPGDRDT